jgi:hypothetical protein
LIAGGADVPSVHSFEVDSRSSQSHPSAFSSASNASYRLRPWYKLEKRRVHKRSTSRSRGKLTTEQKATSHKSHRGKRRNHDSPSEPTLSVLVEFECTRCHAFITHNILAHTLDANVVQCRQCYWEVGFCKPYSVRWAALPEPISVFCGACQKLSHINVGSDAELLMMIQVVAVESPRTLSYRTNQQLMSCKLHRSAARL